MPNRRRFTITYEDGRQEAVFGYSAAGVRAWKAREGARVRTVKLGDYRYTRHVWTLDQEALDAACRELSIELPVRVRKNGRVGRVDGNYRFEEDWHNIMIKGYHTPEKASATIWHELAHAVQAERAGSVFAWGRVMSSEGAIPYARQPTELEADAVAAAHSHVMLTYA